MPRLDSFRRAAFSLQAPRARAAFGLAAAMVLSGGQPTDERHARPAGPLTPEGYGRIVSQVQGAVDRELGYGRVTILDRSAPDDSGRLSERLPTYVEIPAALTTLSDERRPFSSSLRLVEDGGPSWRRPYEIEPGTSCLVGGAQPLAAGGDAVGAAPDALHASAAHRWILWREVGHCLIGPSRAAAEAFAALVTHRDGDPETPRRLSRIPDVDASDPGARIRGIASVAALLDGIAPDRGIQSLAALADRMAGEGAPTSAAKSLVVAASVEVDPDERGGPAP